MKKPKPKLILLSRKKADDIVVLTRMFSKLTGREPTQQEIDDAKKILHG